ncbi:MAG: hypothetical protein RLZZ505_2 [Verrucomicrobiota bacterium]|jgi:autotransporter-associated beta strand protein
MKLSRRNIFFRQHQNSTVQINFSRFGQACVSGLLAITSTALMISSAQGQTNVTWIEGNSTAANRSDWGRAQNWSSGATPTGTGTVAVFDVATQQSPASYATALTIGGFSLTGGQNRSLVFTNTIALNQFGVDNSSAFNFSISGAGATTLAAAQTWSITGTGNTTFSKTITNGGNLLTLEATSTGVGLIDSVISGAGGITKNGTGQWTLSGPNTYTGVTTISNGILSVATIGNGGVAGNLGQATNLAANLVLGGGTLRYTGATDQTDRNFILSAGTTSTIDVTTNTLTMSGASTSTTGALTKTGAGNLILSGANAHTGATTVSAGTLTLGANDRLSNSTAVSVSGGALALGTFNDTVASFAMSGGSLTGSGTLTAGTYGLSGGTVTANLGAGTLNSSGTVTLDGSSAATAVNVTGGTLTLGAANRLNDSAALTVSGGALALGANNDTVGTVTLTGGSITGTSGTLTGSSYAVQNGSISAILGGSGTLTKSTAGTVTLSGANTYSGGTLLNAGTLVASNASAFGTGSITIASGSTLDFSGLSVTNLLINNGGTVTNVGAVLDAELAGGSTTLTANNNTVAVISGSAAVSISGTGTRINSMNGGSVTASSPFTVRSYNRGDIINTAAVTIESGSSDGSITGTGSLTKTGAGTLVLSGSSTYTGATAVTSGVLAVNGSLGNTATTVSDTGTLRGSGTIGGSVTINNGGTIAPGNSIESLGLGDVSFTSGSTFDFELDSTTLNGDLLHSTGSLDIDANATLVLTELVAGTLAVGSKLTLISYIGGWNSGELFSYNGSTLADDSTFILGANQWLFNYNDTSGGSNFTADQAGAISFVTMTAVPEPTAAALLGILGMFALLRRRRS